MPANSELFAQLLNTELQHAEHLHQLLQQELQALQQQQLEPLANLQQPKTAALQTLQQHASQRLDWMTDQQLPHSSACLQRPEFAAHPDLAGLWQQLAAVYQNNQRLSELLAELVLTARKRTLQQLNILRGKQNDPQLYNANGGTSGLNKGSGYTCA